MTEEHELRRLLAGAIPAVPAAPDRAAAARAVADRHRRVRAIGTIVAAVAVALAIAIPVGLSARGGRTSAPAVPAPELPALSCPAEEAAPSEGPAATGAETLDLGAVEARLCNPGGVGWQPPLDSLSGGVAELIALVNRAPVEPASENQVCSMNLGPTWGVAFRYPDGATRFVTAQAHGCGGITVGGVTRGGWDEVNALVDRYLALLRAQRGAGAPAEPRVVSLSCDANDVEAGSDGISMFGNDPQPALTDAILCWNRDTYSEQPTRTAKITPADLQILMTDMAERRTKRSQVDDGSCARGSVDLRIIGQNAWGDRFAIGGYCGEFNVTDNGASFWKPGPESQRILDGLIASGDAAPDLPDAATSADQVVALWGDLVVAQDSRASRLWVGEPPAVNAGALLLKTGGVRAIGARSGYRYAAEVEALFGDTPGTCAPYRDKVFVVVRDTRSEPWRILSWSDGGGASVGC